MEKSGFTRRGFLGGLVAACAAVALPIGRAVRAPVEAVRRKIVSRYEPVPGTSYVIQFPLTMIEPGTETTLRIRPDHHFEPEQLVVSLASGSDFLVRDIVVDRESFFREPKVGVPAFCFAEQAMPPTRMGRCPRGHEIAISVKNIGPEARPFMAAMRGYVLGPARLSRDDRDDDDAGGAGAGGAGSGLRLVRAAA